MWAEIIMYHGSYKVIRVFCSNERRNRYTQSRRMMFHFHPETVDNTKAKKHQESQKADNSIIISWYQFGNKFLYILRKRSIM